MNRNKRYKLYSKLLMEEKDGDVVHVNKKRCKKTIDTEFLIIKKVDVPPRKNNTSILKKIFSGIFK